MNQKSKRKSVNGIIRFSVFKKLVLVKKLVIFFPCIWVEKPIHIPLSKTNTELNIYTHKSLNPIFDLSFHQICLQLERMLT